MPVTILRDPSGFIQRDPALHKILAKAPVCTGDGCTHCINFSVKIDVEEGSGPYFFRFLGCGVWADFDNGWWQFDGVSDSVTIPFDGDPLGSWHSISVVWDATSMTAITLYFVVDGVNSSVMSDDATLYDDGSGAIKLDVGSLFPGGIAHHSIKDFSLQTNDIENFADGIVFKFPDPFDLTTGTGITYVGGIVVVNKDDVDSAYFTKLFSPDPDFPPSLEHIIPPHVPIVCCCHVSQLDDISTVTLEVHLQTVDSCPGSGCFHVDRTLSKTWTRTFEDGIPGPEEFKFYCIDGSDDPMPRTRTINFLAGIDTVAGGEDHASALHIEQFTDGMDCCEGGVNLTPDPNDTTVVRVHVECGPTFDDDPITCDQLRLFPQVLAAGGTCEPNPVLPEWDSGTTYDTGDKVRHGNVVYSSEIDGNIGHEPPAPAFWNAVATQCGEATGRDITEEVFDLGDIAGTHNWSDTWTSAGGVDWQVDFTLTFS